MYIESNNDMRVYLADVDIECATQTLHSWVEKLNCFFVLFFRHPNMHVPEQK